MIKYAVAASAFAAVFVVGAPQAAKAEVIASGHRGGQCLDMKGGTEAILWACHGAGNQTFRFRSGNYGELLTQGRCLSSTGGAGTPLMAIACDGSRRQKWTITGSGALRNEEGWCADVERAGGQGSRVIAWNCSGATNQRWGYARMMSAGQAANQGLLGLGGANAAANARPGVALNAAGVVASGSANVIATGGGNVISTGGGNVMVPVAGVIAVGGGN